MTSLNGMLEYELITRRKNVGPMRICPRTAIIRQASPGKKMTKTVDKVMRLRQVSLVIADA